MFTPVEFVIYLLISDGVILVSNYKSSALVGLKSPVIAMHDWLSSGSSRCACLDLGRDGVAYSATD